MIVRLAIIGNFAENYPTMSGSKLIEEKRTVKDLVIYWMNLEC